VSHNFLHRTTSWTRQKRGGRISYTTPKKESTKPTLNRLNWREKVRLIVGREGVRGFIKSGEDLQKVQKGDYRGGAKQR